MTKIFNGAVSRFFAFCAATLLFLPGCFKAPDDYITEEDLDMVTTNYTQTNYTEPGRYVSFLIADSFNVVSNVKDVGTAEVNSKDFRRLVKTAITDNMLNYGYTAFDTANLPVDTPDIYISVSVTYVNNSGVDYIPTYGGGYYGGYWGWGGYPSYGWDSYWYYYPSYIPSYYSYDVGTLHIDWMDVSTATQIPNDTLWYIDNIWNMSVSGLMRDASTDRGSRIKAAINQGFKQSPYLDKK